MAENVQRNFYGWGGLLFGALALLIAQVSFFGGPFAPPQEPPGVSLGKFVADFKDGVTGKATEQTRTNAGSKTIDDHLKVLVAVLASMSIIAGLIAFVRREQKRLAFTGVALGVCTIIFQFFVWVAFMMIGLFIIWVICDNFDFIDL